LGAVFGAGVSAAFTAFNGGTDVPTVLGAVVGISGSIGCAVFMLKKNSLHKEAS